MLNYNNGYNPNAWLNTPNYSQYNPQTPAFTTTFVSNIAEAIATKPDVTGKPLFFYNKADEEIYVKQYDNTGVAPVKTYKLVSGNTEQQPNPIFDSIKGLNDKLDDIKKMLTPENNEELERKGRR